MLEWIISSSVLAAVLIAVRYIFKGRNRPVIQYAMWALLLIRLIMPFSIGSSFLSVNNLLQTAGGADEAVAEQETGMIFDDILSAETDGQREFSGITDTDKAAEETKNETAAPAPNKAVGNTATSSVTKQILFIIWAAGSICVLIWFLLCNIRYAVCLRKNRVPMDPAAVLGKGQEGLDEGLCRLPVYRSAAIEIPCLFGLFHPAIYVTEEVCQNAVILRHVLIHENMHYRHGDHIWSALRGICIAVHWFNPLVWWAAFLSRRDCELACDEATLKILGANERSGYGNTLLKITCTNSSVSMLTATNISGKKSAIYERIKVMTSANNKSIVSIIVALLIVVIAAGCTFTGAAENAVEEKTQESAVAEEQTYVSAVEGRSIYLPISIEYAYALEDIPTELLEQIYEYEDSLHKYHYDYDKKKYITIDGREYKYLYIKSDFLEPAAMNTCYVILTNRDDVTFEECVRSEKSSNPEERFDAEETIIVWKYFGEMEDYFRAEETASWEYIDPIMMKGEIDYILNNHEWKIGLVRLDYPDNANDCSLTLEITNKTDEFQTYRCSFISINDTPVESDSSLQLDPGQSSEISLILPGSRLKEAGITDIETLSIRVETVHENRPPNPVLTYTFDSSELEKVKVN